MALLDSIIFRVFYRNHLLNSSQICRRFRVLMVVFFFVITKSQPSDSVCIQTAFSVLMYIWSDWASNTQKAGNCVYVPTFWAFSLQFLEVWAQYGASKITWLLAAQGSTVWTPFRLWTEEDWFSPRIQTVYIILLKKKKAELSSGAHSQPSNSSNLID